MLNKFFGTRGNEKGLDDADSTVVKDKALGKGKESMVYDKELRRFLIGSNEKEREEDRKRIKEEIEKRKAEAAPPKVPFASTQASPIESVDYGGRRLPKVNAIKVARPSGAGRPLGVPGLLPMGEAIPRPPESDPNPARPPVPPEEPSHSIPALPKRYSISNPPPDPSMNDVDDAQRSSYQSSNYPVDQQADLSHLHAMRPVTIEARHTSSHRPVESHRRPSSYSDTSSLAPMESQRALELRKRIESTIDGTHLEVHNKTLESGLDHIGKLRKARLLGVPRIRPPSVFSALSTPGASPVRRPLGPWNDRVLESDASTQISHIPLKPPVPDLVDHDRVAMLEHNLAQLDGEHKRLRAKHNRRREKFHHLAQAVDRVAVWKSGLEGQSKAFRDLLNHANHLVNDIEFERKSELSLILQGLSKLQHDMDDAFMSGWQNAMAENADSAKYPRSPGEPRPLNPSL